MRAAVAVRLADFRFEAVTHEVPSSEPDYPKAPQNLDLAED
jgi:hypothetical protein